MSCAAPTFFLLLETGSYLLQEDRSRVVLELATTTGAFVCGATILPGALLFPPRVVQGTRPPVAQACAELIAPTLVAVEAVTPRPARQVVSRSPAPRPATPRSKRCDTTPAFPIDPNDDGSTC